MHYPYRLLVQTSPVSQAGLADQPLCVHSHPRRRAGVAVPGRARDLAFFARPLLAATTVWTASLVVVAQARVLRLVAVSALLLSLRRLARRAAPLGRGRRVLATSERRARRFLLVGAQLRRVRALFNAPPTGTCDLHPVLFLLASFGVMFRSFRALVAFRRRV